MIAWRLPKFATRVVKVHGFAARYRPPTSKESIHECEESRRLAIRTDLPWGQRDSDRLQPPGPGGKRQDPRRLRPVPGLQDAAPAQLGALPGRSAQH